MQNFFKIKWYVIFKLDDQVEKISLLHAIFLNNIWLICVMPNKKNYVHTDGLHVPTNSYNFT